MTDAGIARARLAGQRLTGARLAGPAEVVATLGAVQAQDYAGARWGVGQRAHGATDAAVERALTDGAIVRTHVLRPTWHFVAPGDLRWLLALTAARVHAGNAAAYRELELDPAVRARSREVLVAALRDGVHRTRDELADDFERAGLSIRDRRRLGYLMMAAELDGVVCSGPRRGKRFTYALVDERVPPAPPRDRDESLAVLALRYFSTRGPASLQDFAWWSGLTVADGRRALAEIGPELEPCEHAGRTLWGRAREDVPGARPSAHLLPAFDELFVGLRDRSAHERSLLRARRPAPFAALPGAVLLVGGQFVGGWTRTLSARRATVRASPLTPLGAAARARVARACDAYGAFLGLEAEIVWEDGGT